MKDFVHDYESFLYGKSVLKPDELFPENDPSVETAGLFTSPELANIFFRYSSADRKLQSMGDKPAMLAFADFCAAT